MPAFHYIPVASSFLSGEEFEQIAAEYAGALERVGGVRVGPESIGTSARLAFFVLTGGTERRILELREKRAAVAPDEPALLAAYSGRNSLPAALEVLARLQQDGAAGSIVLLDGPWHETGLGSSGEGGRPFAPGRALRGRRIGLVGGPSDWLVASSPAPSLVRDVWGAEVVELPMGELFVSGDVYVGLRRLVNEHGLDAIALRCFDLVTERGITGCLALSRLADEGVVAGCEGDLVSTLAMLWVRERLGEPSWMANPARVDAGANELTLAHCTVPTCMVSGHTLTTHFESGLGTAIRGDVPTGPVTLVRIGGRGLDRLWLAEGEVIASHPEETMCRTQARLRLRSGYGSASDLLERPLGNHLVLTRGHVAGRLLGG
jgi:L-fucose isomerase-like protein